MRFARSNSSSATGFTLVEMVVVVVIIGITSAMVIPEMKGTFADALLRSSARDLANAANMASSRAVSLNQSCRLNLDTHNGRYEIERASHLGNRVEYVPLKDVPGAVGQVDTRVSMVVAHPAANSPEEGGPLPLVDPTAPEAISFYSDGTADAAEIRLRDRDGYQVILQISPVTGRVRLSDPVHE